MITLTQEQIKELAEFAGLVILAVPRDDFENDEFVICECPPEGIRNDGEPGDPGSVWFYDYIVYCEDCPEEGCMGLGPERPRPILQPETGESRNDEQGEQP